VGVLWEKWQNKVSALKQAHLDVSQDLQEYRWLIEELRVSLFAQELKTPFPVSIKRLEKTWSDIS
jgi:ATP-dependent helicase HrpA